MTPADILLNHFDRIAGTKPQFVRVSDEGATPAIHVAIYRGFPEPDGTTGFTVGLSHFHPPNGSHKELTISMRDTDIAWALACGMVAFQLRERCPFSCGDTINFREPIAKSSALSAFMILHPRNIATADTVIDLGRRTVEIVQLVPIYEEEQSWLRNGGNLTKFLKDHPAGHWMEPQRKLLAQISVLEQ
jgi:Suppressor of fused protein (SUFU)